MNIDTAIVLDGGRDENGGAPYYDAAYEHFLGRTAISYPVDQLLRTKNIKRIYISTDRIEKAARSLESIHELHSNIETLFPGDPMNGTRSVRFVPASKDGRLMKSLRDTVYLHITADNPLLETFEGDTSDISDLVRYGKENPEFCETAIFVTGNDVINLQAGYIDRMINDFKNNDQDVMIGYTQKKDLDAVLKKNRLSISQFHPTLGKTDFLNGKYSRSNGTFIIKWGKINAPMLEVVSYFNTHRYQSRFINYVLLLKKTAHEFRNNKKALLYGFTHFAFPFFIGKYMRNLNSRKIADIITPYVSNENIGKRTKNLAGFKLYIRDTTDTPETVIDIDSPSDKVPIEKILSSKYKT